MDFVRFRPYWKRQNRSLQHWSMMKNLIQSRSRQLELLRLYILVLIEYVGGRTISTMVLFDKGFNCYTELFIRYRGSIESKNYVTQQSRKSTNQNTGLEPLQKAPDEFLIVLSLCTWQNFFARATASFHYYYCGHVLH